MAESKEKEIGVARGEEKGKYSEERRVANELKSMKV